MEASDVATATCAASFGRAPAEVAVKTDPSAMTDVELAREISRGIVTPAKPDGLLAILGIALPADEEQPADGRSPSV